jgi:hypothetical protein
MPRNVTFAISVLLGLFAASPLSAEKVENHYDVTFSVFGKIGVANINMECDNGRYHLHADGRLTGFAASLGQHLKESHDSYGTIVDGIFVPERYVKVRLKDDHRDETIYTFDPGRREITKRRLRERGVLRSRFDIATMSAIQETVIEKSDATEVLPYYAQNDLLSLLFNVRHLIAFMPEGSQRLSHTAGTNNDKGEVLIGNPGSRKRARLRQLMPDNGDRLVTVLINQDIFESEKGELLLNLDSDYFISDAMLQDVVLFGDIHAKRVRKNGLCTLLETAAAQTP